MNHENLLAKHTHKWFIGNEINPAFAPCIRSTKQNLAVNYQLSHIALGEQKTIGKHELACLHLKNGWFKGITTDVSEILHNSPFAVTCNLEPIL